MEARRICWGVPEEKEAKSGSTLLCFLSFCSGFLFLPAALLQLPLPPPVELRLHDEGEDGRPTLDVFPPPPTWPTLLKIFLTLMVIGWLVCWLKEGGGAPLNSFFELYVSPSSSSILLLSHSYLLRFPKHIPTKSKRGRSHNSTERGCVYY